MLLMKLLCSPCDDTRGNFVKIPELLQMHASEIQNENFLDARDRKG
jgi:hypothetical protein